MTEIKRDASFGHLKHAKTFKYHQQCFVSPRAQPLEFTRKMKKDSAFLFPVLASVSVISCAAVNRAGL